MICAVHYPDDDVSVVKVIPPIGTNSFLTCKGGRIKCDVSRDQGFRQDLGNWMCKINSFSFLPDLQPPKENLAHLLNNGI